LEARVGIELTHKGFADRLSQFVWFCAILYVPAQSMS